MRICILSMQRVQNFGSLLQCYGLKSMLEQLGHTVTFLDIEPNQAEDQLLCGKKNRFDSEGENSIGLLSKLKKLDKYVINRVLIKFRSHRQDMVFEEFRKAKLGMREDANSEHYDCCVIGSDEVFNCLSGASWGFTSQLFGNVRQADRVITYAASCGATSYEDIPEQVAEAIRDAFTGVAGFSVRDKNTGRFVSQLSTHPVTYNLDPVLVSDFSVEMENAVLPPCLPKRYCVVYSYYNRIHDEHEIDAIKRFCKTHGMEPVAVGAPQKWIRNYLVLDPFQMLKVFQNASFVITDTFHGTIFSAKYSKRFAVMIRPSNTNKLGDLIDRLDLASYRITGTDQLNAAFESEHDTDRIFALTAIERSRSLEYLSQFIKG